MEALRDGPLRHTRLIGKMGRVDAHGLDGCAKAGGKLLIHSLANIGLTNNSF